MSMVKIPKMNKEEYDKLIIENHVSRIASKGDDFPYIAPFMYVFEQNEEFLYFLSTNYGMKIKIFKQNPNVAVEIEKYNNDMSSYKFITLQGRIIEVKDLKEQNKVKKQFVDMIQDKLSPKALAALGYSPDKSPESILEGENTLLWKLVDVENIVALKNP
ncbi:pyridoxamine 5'-phosphate oxidase family protein [Methanobacterium oryzae]|uniref:pyridoxamine 5'-phosphate oxidase family protein n=1 Tax=Methanobacterium oryzae TaxID=69540 RepID=UPI003D21274B